MLLHHLNFRFYTIFGNHRAFNYILGHAANPHNRHQFPTAFHLKGLDSVMFCCKGTAPTDIKEGRCAKA